jgi:predicted hotdog family 3-hydroxylacyl-ACP dehydratase
MVRVLVSRPTAPEDDNAAMLGVLLGTRKDEASSSALRFVRTAIA